MSRKRSKETQEIINIQEVINDSIYEEPIEQKEPVNIEEEIIEPKEIPNIEKEAIKNITKNSIIKNKKTIMTNTSVVFRTLPNYNKCCEASLMPRYTSFEIEKVVDGIGGKFYLLNNGMYIPVNGKYIIN